MHQPLCPIRYGMTAGLQSESRIFSQQGTRVLGFMAPGRGISRNVGRNNPVAATGELEARLVASQLVASRLPASGQPPPRRF